jgi:hypothetical protein
MYVKIKKHYAPLHGSAARERQAQRENEVQREIENFLQAVRSYPDRFAREPDLSFQQHLCSIATGADSHGTDE